MIFPQDENEEPTPQLSSSGQRNPPLPPVALDLFAAQTRTILVVDPSPTVRDLIQSILQKEHLHVIFANDTSSALASIAAHHPHLVLLSSQLPRADGYHLCRMIRQRPHLARLPVILLGEREASSSYARRGRLAEPTHFLTIKGRLAGATDFLIMPFDSHQLVQMVNKYLPA
jgi:two-component system chemotaxis response regulator CheY